MIRSQDALNIDYYEWASRRITQATFLLAFAMALVALMLAISWIRRPFPGFTVEPTLVVNDIGGNSWDTGLAVPSYPERVVRIGGFAVQSPAEFKGVLSEQTVGQTVSIMTELPDGSMQVYPSITLRSLPFTDFANLFLLPYTIGIVYLAIGIWIYRMKGGTRPGRTLAFFCACTSLACTLVFDLSTTHTAAAIWTAAIAMIGGALISLALRFPLQWKPVERQPLLLAVPYAASAAIGAWGVLMLSPGRNPWAYIEAWGASYRYAAFGILLFLAVMVYRALTANMPVVRQQARIVLLGSTIAFTPITLWFLAPVFNLPIRFNVVVLLPELILFPVTVAVAIFRYRLLEMDVIVNRTIVYGTLTAILAGLFTAGTLAFRSIFIAVTGDRSDVGVIIVTLIVASAFTPLKSRLQAFVDNQFKQLPDNTRTLRGYGGEVQSFMRMHDPRQITQRLLHEAAASLGARSGALSLAIDGRLQTVHTYGRWKGDAWLSLRLECEGDRLGILSLGPRLNGEGYAPYEVETLQQVIMDVACAVRMALVLSELAAPAKPGIEYGTLIGVPAGAGVPDTGAAARTLVARPQPGRPPM